MSNVTIPGLVAENISQPLADKIKNYIGGGIKVLNDIETLWISSAGSDSEDSDGSKEKPFKTLAYTLSYFNHKVYANGYQVNIAFLTDYTDAPTAKNLIYAENCGTNSLLYIYNPQGKEVTLAETWIHSGFVCLRDVNIIARNNPALVALNNAEVVLRGTFNITVNTNTVALWAQRGGTIYFANTTVLNINRSDASKYPCLRAELGGKFSRIAVSDGAPAQINVTGDWNAFVEIKATSAFDIANLVKVTWNSGSGKRFILYAGGVIDTYHSGAEWFPGTEAGTIEEGGIYR